MKNSYFNRFGDAAPRRSPNLRVHVLGWTGLSLLALTPPAHATYSIVASDSDTGQVGGAIASCVGAFSLSIVYRSVPGAGAVHAQASVGVDGRDRAVELLDLGTPPADIIAEITDPAFDPNAAVRQYGIVDLMGRAAGWTGGGTGAYAEDRQGGTSLVTVSIQGNILTGDAVLDQAEAAFAAGCDLADSLMLALEAGGENGEGDSRCTPSGIPADSAFLQVDRPDEPPGSWLSIDVVDTAPDSPLPLVRAQYDEWRLANPCPAGGGDAGADASSPIAGGTDGSCGCRVGAAEAQRVPALLPLLLVAAAVVRRRGGR